MHKVKLDVVEKKQLSNEQMSIEQMENVLAMHDLTCTCGALLGSKIEYYEHEGGWRVPSSDKRLWLYTTCPECGYEWSLWKIGFPRN